MPLRFIRSFFSVSPFVGCHQCCHCRTGENDHFCAFSINNNVVFFFILSAVRRFATSRRLFVWPRPKWVNKRRYNAHSQFSFSRSNRFGCRWSLFVSLFVDLIQWNRLALCGLSIVRISLFFFCRCSICDFFFVSSNVDDNVVFACKMRIVGCIVYSQENENVRCQSSVDFDFSRENRCRSTWSWSSPFSVTDSFNGMWKSYALTRTNSIQLKAMSNQRTDWVAAWL